ncbi:AAA family ATPase [Candidatus Woesearchaeota archaeon]|nr:AAA family ATPase [Candidatus Woesearchaeota archaeon]
MKIQKIEIKNLRSFNSEGATIENLANLNLLVGKNNSGKSNMGIALETIFQGLSISSNLIPLGGTLDKIDDTFWFNKLTSSKEKPVSIQISMDSVLYDKDIKDMLKGVKDDSNKRSFIQDNHGSILSLEINISLSPNSDRTIVSLKKALLAGAIFYLQDSKGFNYFNFENYVEEHSQNKPDRTLEIIKDFLKNKFLMIKSNRMANTKIAEEFESMEKNLNLKKGHIFAKVNDYMKLLFPYLKDSIKTYDYIRGKELHIEDNLHLPISSYGEGIAQIFTILFYIFRENADIIFIEEPEAYLHPTLLKKFVGMLEKIAKDEYKQFFLVTHSTIPLNVDRINNTYRFSFDKENGTKVHTLGKNNINIDRLRQEFNPDSAEIFFTDKVILVEGKEDEYFIEGLFNRIVVGNNDYKVISVGSNGNFGIYKEILSAFNISFSIICDGNCLLENYAIKIISDMLKDQIKLKTIEEKKEYLKSQKIWILPKEDISDFYPERFKNLPKEPKRALKVLTELKQEDISQGELKILGEIITEAF